MLLYLYDTHCTTCTYCTWQSHPRGPTTSIFSRLEALQKTYPRPLPCLICIMGMPRHTQPKKETTTTFSLSPSLKITVALEKGIIGGKKRKTTLTAGPTVHTVHTCVHVYLRCTPRVTTYSQTINIQLTEMLRGGRESSNKHIKLFAVIRVGVRRGRSDASSRHPQAEPS